MNTTMQNIMLTSDIQSKVVGFLQYTQKAQENQKELILFIENISPSLKHRVYEFIFRSVVEKHEVFFNEK